MQIDRVDAENGSALEFDTVLMVSNDQGVQIGAPFIQGAKVKATISGTARGEKVISYKYKRRKSYHRTVGSRQMYTLIKVEDIVLA